MYVGHTEICTVPLSANSRRVRVSEVGLCRIDCCTSTAAAATEFDVTLSMRGTPLQLGLTVTIDSVIGNFRKRLVLIIPASDGRVEQHLTKLSIIINK